METVWMLWKKYYTDDEFAVWDLYSTKQKGIEYIQMDKKRREERELFPCKYHLEEWSIN